jgi:hypothetical protein
MTITTKMRCALAALTLLAASAANAEPLFFFHPAGVRTAPDSFEIHDALSPGEYDLVYAFELTNGADAFGETHVAEASPGSSLTINFVTLFAGNIVTGKVIGTDTSPDQFSFLGLTDHAFSLLVRATVTGDTDDRTRLRGNFRFELPVATSVPEPGTFALAGVGLLALGLTMRRRIFA